MPITLSGTTGITTPGVTDTGTLSVTGVTTLTGGLNAALPVLSGGTGVTTSTGSGAVVLGTSPTLTTPTFDSASLATISGTAPLYMCRAWVNFNGTGTVAIRASGNVSSITDGGAGLFAVNFTTAIADINYSISVNASNSFAVANIFSPSLNTGASGNEVAPTTTSCAIYIATANSSAFDPKYVNAAIFR